MSRTSRLSRTLCPVDSGETVQASILASTGDHTAANRLGDMVECGLRSLACVHVVEFVREYSATLGLCPDDYLDAALRDAGMIR